MQALDQDVTFEAFQSGVDKFQGRLWRAVSGFKPGSASGEDHAGPIGQGLANRLGDRIKAFGNSYGTCYRRAGCRQPLPHNRGDLILLFAV